MPALLAFLAAFVPLAQAPIHTFHGDSPNDEFGVSAALVGDTNRDGYADILVGAHWDDNNGSDSGSARLFSGVDGAVLGTFYGDAPNDFFGLAVAGVGDVDYDGFDDFAVGSDSSNLGGVDAGLVRVFSGKTHAVLRNITGSFAGQQIGAAMARVDSTDLLLAGAPASEQAIAVSARTGVIAWTFYSFNPGDQFGAAVASGRDLDGDGVPDYAIGAPTADVAGTDSGSVTLFSGATGNQIRVLHGLADSDRFGSAVALLPDADGDGRGELVVGAPRANGPGSDAGAIYLYSGASGSLIFSRAGESAGDQFGTAVASMATLKGNPEPVFVVGARWNDVGGANAGAAYVYSALNGALLQVLRGHTAGDWFGGAVAGGADVDGNGIGDLVVSARLADVNGSDSGSVEVHASPLVPKTWYVDAAVAGPGEGTQASPYKSIQYAINRSTTRSGDTLRVASGTYFENLVIDGKVLQLVGEGATRPIIDGQQITSCIRLFESASPVSLQFMVFTNGAGFDPDPVNGDLVFGAGVFFQGSVLTIRDCLVTQNRALDGKNIAGIGICASGDIVRVENCQVTFNHENDPWAHVGSSGGGGAGLSVAADTVIIEDTHIQGNSCAGDGGGAAIGGRNVTVRGCSVVSNGGSINGYYPNAGGLDLIGDEVLVETCWISSNLAADNAGGIRTSGNVTIRNCVIERNLCWNGYEGGGIYATGPGTVLESSIVVDNYNHSGGGAAGPIQAIDTTFALNRVEEYSGCHGRGGGLFGGTALRCLFSGNRFVGTSCGGTSNGEAAWGATLQQCTIVGHTSYPSGASTTYSCTLDSCIVWDNLGVAGDGGSTAIYSDIEGGWSGTGNIAVDPLFLVPEYNFHLTALSPCIDSGNPSLPNDPDGSRADMGAFPYDPNYCPPPFAFCSGKVNSCGTTPAISWTGSPTVGASSGFLISASRARANKPGLLLYSPNGMGSAPFQGGTLCIAAQGLRRGPQVTSIGGSSPTACDATFSIDWAAFASGALGGTPQPYLNQLGQRVNVQWWGRDNTVVGSFLSNAIQYEVCQ